MLVRVLASYKVMHHNINVLLTKTEIIFKIVPDHEKMPNQILIRDFLLKKSKNNFLSPSV